MTRPASPLPLRRPPAPAAGGSTVTRLVPPRAGGHREPVPAEPVQGTLALDLGRLGAHRSPAAPPLRVVEDGPAPGPEEVRAWAGTFAQAVVEVVSGDRPVTQLLRCTSAQVYQDLGRRVSILARTRSAPQRRRTVRPQVSSVHVCRPADRCAEVSVHVRHGQRSRAIAARLEHRDGRWTCTALELG